MSVRLRYLPIWTTGIIDAGSHYTPFIQILRLFCMIYNILLIINYPSFSFKHKLFVIFDKLGICFLI